MRLNVRGKKYIIKKPAFYMLAILIMACTIANIGIRGIDNVTIDSISKVSDKEIKTVNPYPEEMLLTLNPIPDDAPEVISRGMDTVREEIHISNPNKNNQGFNVSQKAKELCDKYGIKYHIFMGLMKTESGFNPNVISSTNDYGICQINKINHSWLMSTLHLDNIMEPAQNMECSAYMLSNLYSKYPEYTDHMILMSYNQGETGAKRSFASGVYNSNYSNKVLNNAELFKTNHDDIII